MSDSYSFISWYFHFTVQLNVMSHADYNNWSDRQRVLSCSKGIEYRNVH